jgi:hypothetical protein
MNIQLDIEVLSSNHCCRGKTVLHILSVFFVSLVSNMQRACAVLYCHLWPIGLNQIFPHYLINDKMLGGGEHRKKCVF